MSDPMTVYISGRVTGQPRDAVKAKFSRAAALLYANNHNPEIPTLICDPADGPREAMAKLIPVLLKCDAIMMLEDWEYSEGAKIELQIAKYAGLHIMFEEDFI
jgi:hypothetical protein